MNISSGAEGTSPEPNEDGASAAGMVEEGIPQLGQSLADASNFTVAANPNQSGTPTERTTWLFQASPKRYRILESLAAERQEMWNLRHFKDIIAIGDRIIIWLAGADAGIYATGTVISPATVMADTPTGQAYWTTGEGSERRHRVQVRYDQVFLDRPLSKQFIQTDPVLCELAVLKMPQGTNYPVSEEQWQAINAWLQAMPQSLTLSAAPVVAPNHNQSSSLVAP